MKKYFILGVIAISFGISSRLSAQDNYSNGRALNIPFRRYGISLGNSYEFNGLRINFIDRDVSRINGINITFWTGAGDVFTEISSAESVINGISIGIAPTGGTMQPVNLSLLRIASAKNLNGLTISGFNLYAANHINGIALNGLIMQANVISGISVSGVALGGIWAVNGISIGGLAVSSDRGNMNGLAISPGILICGNTLKGIGISGLYLNSSYVRGITISSFAQSEQTIGLSIALFNRTKELHGVQLGLLNYAGNNRKGARLLPVINLHLRKTKAPEPESQKM